MRVSGAGMQDIETRVARDSDAVVVNVPVGPDRVFELVAPTTTTTLENPIIDYRGKGQAAVSSDGANVNVSIGIGKTAIVVPDTDNTRLAQIDSIAGGNDSWETLNLSDYGNPRDVDFDSQGRIYIAAGFDIVRVGNIGDDNPQQILSGSFNFNSIAIDRDSGTVYFASRSDISKADLDGANVVSFLSNEDIYPSYNIQGLAVDAEGYLLAAQAPGVKKIDPDTKEIVASFDLPGYVDDPPEAGVSDVMVRDNEVFVLSFSAPDPGTAVYKLDTSLSVIDSYGRTETDGSADEPGEFWGPRRFVATLNRKITIADWRELPLPKKARLVSLDDLDGSGWQTYGIYGSSVGEFHFDNYYYDGG